MRAAHGEDGKVVVPAPGDVAAQVLLIRQAGVARVAGKEPTNGELDIKTIRVCGQGKSGHEGHLQIKT